MTPDDLRRGVDRLAAARAEEDRGIRDGSELGDACRELQRRLVRLVAEDVVRGEGAELRGDRFGDLDAAVADVGEPETGRRVEVLPPRGVPDRASLAARENELVPVDLAHRREGVPESVLEVTRASLDLANR